MRNVNMKASECDSLTFGHVRRFPMPVTSINQSIIILHRFSVFFYLIYSCYFSWGWTHRCVVTNLLDNDIVVSSMFIHAIIFNFGLIPLVKVWTHLSPLMWDKYFTGQQQICCQRFFLVDLERIWCAESKNHIGFGQSGQVWAMATCFLRFVPMYTSGERFRRSWWR